MRRVARVFLSYRRADGQYAVGWIAAALSQLTSDPAVEVAFRDGNLRGGDDFPAALARKVESCDVLVAVIGPHWHGRRGDGTTRIRDAGDWVGREITSALENDKIIVPVLINGAEPLRPEELLPEHRSFADLHAVRFDNEEHLEELLADIQSHLRDLDDEKARTKGLDQPVTLERFTPPWWVLALALAAAAPGAVIGAWLSGTLSEDPTDFRDATMAVQTALGASLAVCGWWYFTLRLHPFVRVRWRPVMGTMAFILAVLLWGASQYGDLFSSRNTGDLTLALSAIALIAPWILTAVGAAWVEPLSGEHETRRRALMIGELSRAGVVSCGLLGAYSVVAVVAAAAGLSRDGTGTPAAISTLVTYGGFLTIVITAVLVYGRTRLERESLELQVEIADLAVNHRDHVTPLLVREPLGTRVRWIGIVLVLPLLCGVGLAIAYPSAWG